MLCMKKRQAFMGQILNYRNEKLVKNENKYYRPLELYVANIS
jgi:hypothetical protein